MDARLSRVATTIIAGVLAVACNSSMSPAPITPLPASSPRATPDAGTSPRWIATGPMSEARHSPTATLLPDGRVLVAGGVSDGGPSASAELFDPASGTWSATGTMTEARSGHTATLLLDGRVLVAGGSSGSTDELPSASAELFDPASGTWTVTANMLMARRGHTATPVADGRVLVVSGDGGVPGDAELYDPRGGTWTVTSDMGGPRVGHTATLLADGRVFIASLGRSIVDAIVLFDDTFDPATGIWGFSRGAADVRNAGHTATLLSDGRVLLAGGSLPSYAALWDPGGGGLTFTGSMATRRQYHTATLLRDGTVLIVGGSGTAAGPSAELYEPVSNSWAAAAELIHPRTAGHTSTLLQDGRVLVAGGSGLAVAELYDPGGVSTTPSPSPSRSATPAGLAPGTWTATGAMIENRNFPTATLLVDGRVLVAGGVVIGDGGADPSPSAELFDPATGTWTATGDMNEARFYHTATLLPDGTVLVAGGWNALIDPPDSASAELYDPATGIWTAIGNMNEGRAGHTATLLVDDSAVLVASGGTAELYDPVGRTWTATGRMVESRGAHSATLLADGRVLVAGNGFGPSTASAELYDPASRTWRATGSMTEARGGHSATRLDDGMVLVAGGETPDAPDGVASSELFDPTTGTWTVAGTMNVARFSHTATLLADGTVLVAGGGSAELYDPANRSWAATVAMTEPRSGQTATLLADGTVLVAGAGWVGPTASAELFDPRGGS